MIYAEYSPRGSRKQQHPIKLPTDSYQQLKEIASHYNLPQAHVLETLILTEYNKFKFPEINLSTHKLTAYEVLSTLT